jgi:hypothetical protein
MRGTSVRGVSLVMVAYFHVKPSVRGRQVVKDTMGGSAQEGTKTLLGACLDNGQK